MNNDKDKSDNARKAYFAIVSFEETVNTVTTLSAKDEQHARELVPSFFAGKKDVKILDLYELKDAPANPDIPTDEEVEVMLSNVNKKLN